MARRQRSRPNRKSPAPRVDPRRKLALLEQELARAQEQQRATAHILRAIRTSRSDLPGILKAVAENAARLCDADVGQIFRIDGGLLRAVASYGPIPSRLVGETTRITRGSVAGRAVVDRQTVHVRDLSSELDTEFPDAKPHSKLWGHRTTLATPLLGDDGPIGAIFIRRTDVRPFSDAQIALLETFADQAVIATDQAVIAIENVRLFNELEARNRELSEALEQQTATAEVLKVISRSTFDLQPVLDTLIENATQLCSASKGFIFRRDGDVYRLEADYGASAEYRDFIVRNPIPLGRGTIVGRTALERRTVHFPDILADPEYQWPESQRIGGFRTVLGVPMLREGNPIGVIAMWREEVRPFTDKQIELVTTFADQAVIAIENVRLLQELQARNRELSEALEQQTATAEILQVISSSPTDIQPVLNAVAENAARVCGADDAVIFRVDGDRLRGVVHNGSIPVPDQAATEGRLPGRDSVVGRAVTDRRTIHVPDIEGETGNEFPWTRSLARPVGARTLLAAPLLREDAVIGIIVIRRLAVQPFTPKQVTLLETFASQAVIAIENVRLFKELETRNSDLTAALDQQTATAEILGVIASSPTDVQPVFDTIVASAVRLCGALYGLVYRFDGELVHAVAHHGLTPEEVEQRRRRFPRPLSDLTVGGPLAHALATGRVSIVADVEAESGLFSAEIRAQMRARGVRSNALVPMVRQSRVIGAIGVQHRDVGAFTDARVDLLKTFADQAVIAIENVRLFKELEARNRELTEALEQQTATGDVLKVISRSTFDLRPVLEILIESATRLCGAEWGVILRPDGEVFRAAGVYGAPPEHRDFVERNPIQPGRGSVAGRVAIERRVVHVHDVLADPEYRHLEHQEKGGFRTVLGVPMLREGALVGVFFICRNEVRPFTEKQIELVTTFADQGVIAIENVRLFNELETRNRDLTEALEQQTATAEILSVISSSPTDVQPVFDSIARSATRLCDGLFGGVFLCEGGAIDLAAHYNFTPEGLAAFKQVYPRPLDTASNATQAIRERRPVHVVDCQTDPANPPLSRRLALALGFRSLIVVPMLREGEALGAIGVSRSAVKPFSEREIALLKTFADQAVIAIENMRLFNELQARTRELTRSVQELRALGEVGQAVSSTLDLETVLRTIVSRAVQLSGTDGGTVYEYDEAAEVFRLRATHNLDETVVTVVRGTPIRKGEGVQGRMAVTREPVQIPDIAQEGAYHGPLHQVLLRAGIRALLAVPLLREEHLIGSLIVNRKAPGEFPPEVVDVLKTFATQSALAIQNARLFREIEEKGRQLEVASRHKSQFLANMSHELRTPLNAILGYTELIADSLYGEVPERIREVLERVDKSGRHLLGLINDVLDLSKIEAGQLTLALGDYSLREIVQTVVGSVESLAAEKKLALSVLIDPDLPAGWGDPRRISQVLLNLVGNALKFTEAGGVRIEAKLVDGAFHIAVSDTGPGIAPADQGKIFEEFQQLDSSTTRRQGGTGLGLSIARRIVELHGGRIGLDSTPGQGSTFWFTLPVHAHSSPGAA